MRHKLLRGNILKIKCTADDLLSMEEREHSIFGRYIDQGKHFNAYMAKRPARPEDFLVATLDLFESVGWNSDSDMQKMAWEFRTIFTLLVGIAPPLLLDLDPDVRRGEAGIAP